MNADIYAGSKCYKMPQYEEILQYDPQILFIFRSLASNFLAM